MADSYVCSGAMMKCTMGTSPARLTVLPNRMVFLAGQLMANISDHQTMANLAPFGLCRSLAFPPTASATSAAMGTLTPMPCMHNTPAPWIGGKMDYLIKGQPALLQSCKCQCMWGGTISLINNGQVGEGAQGVNETRRAFLGTQRIAELRQKVKEEKEALENSPYQLKAKTVAEAEKEIAQNLGVTCNFEGFTDEDLPLIQEIYSSVATHIDKYPDLKKYINFVGSMQGRREVYAEWYYNELKRLNPTVDDDRLREKAKADAASIIKIDPNTYAVSTSGYSCKEVNGVAFNADFKGDTVQNSLDYDLKTKWHPDGCNTVKSVFDHELGHKIDETLGLNSDPEFLKIFEEAEKEGKEYIKDNLSAYAYKQSEATDSYDPKKEFIAEAWSEYLNNPNPRPIAKSVGDLIVKKTNWGK